MTLSLKQTEVARHALGLPNPRNKSFRNRFHAYKDSDDHATWMSLVHRGDAGMEEGQVMDRFWLTTQTALSVLSAGETLDHEDFPAPAGATN